MCQLTLYYDTLRKRAYQNETEALYDYHHHSNEEYKSTKELNKTYKRNQIKENDHRQTPPIVLNIIQDIIETKYAEKIGARFFDVCPYQCLFLITRKHEPILITI